MPIEPSTITSRDLIDTIADDDVMPIIDVSASTPSAKGKKASYTKIAAWILAKFPVPSQETVEAGENTTPGLITSQRIAQAIAAAIAEIETGGLDETEVNALIAAALEDFEGGGGGPLSNYAATTNPGVGDDETDGYSVGSTWINVATNTIWKCTDPSEGAALWERVDQDPGTLNNFAATTNPGVGDDSEDGYSVGSRWINVTLDTSWTCTDASVGAAVWSQDNAPGGGLENPMTTIWDLIVGGTAGAPARLATGPAYTWLAARSEGLTYKRAGFTVERELYGVSSSISADAEFALFVAPANGAIVGVRFEGWSAGSYPVSIQVTVNSSPVGLEIVEAGLSNTANAYFYSSFVPPGEGNLPINLSAGDEVGIVIIGDGANSGTEALGSSAAGLTVTLVWEPV